MKSVVVTGGFDDFGSRHLRWLEEASKLGSVTVLLWPDETLRQVTGRDPSFPFAERLYFLKAVRYVGSVVPVPTGFEVGVLPQLPGLRPEIWVDDENRANETRLGFSQKHGLQYHVIPSDRLKVFPAITAAKTTSGRKKVVVTGCYDWFHSGHVRFFQEVSTFGDLYVIVGHDANIRLLKGPGHPLLPEQERRYMAGSIRCVTQALISTGQGWLDAEPEIQRIQPQIYAVNEDGDRGGKREYCLKHGIQYLVLKRLPAPGLRPRSSTQLRGF